MKNIITAVIFTLIFPACAKKTEKPAVDKRVELLGIVFRLAEKQEYSTKKFNLYDEKIESYFEKYKNHRLIQFTKSIICENGIAFDGPMWMAMHLDDNLKLLKDVKDVWQHDPRWAKENVEKFVPLLQQFYVDTRFDEFFKSNADLYEEAANRFTPIVEQLDLNWCYSFFGVAPKEQFFVKIGLCIWGNCFGVNVDYTNGYRNVYAIMGMWKIDDSGFPEFSIAWDLPILIHELSHPFIDKLTEKRRDSFRESGEKIFSVVKEVLGTEAYPAWEVVLDEALVHASMIKYMKDHDFKQSEIENLIHFLKYGMGFFWIEELAEELDKYDMQRDKYPTLESYMPKLGEAYKIWLNPVLN